MDYYIRKIKTKEGINSLDIEKIKKSIPAGYKPANSLPEITFTANYAVLHIMVQETKKTAPPQKHKKSKVSLKTS
jgi:hypothetical protein